MSTNRHGKDWSICKLSWKCYTKDEDLEIRRVGLKSVPAIYVMHCGLLCVNRNIWNGMDKYSKFWHDHFNYTRGGSLEM